MQSNIFEILEFLSALGIWAWAVTGAITFGVYFFISKVAFTIRLSDRKVTLLVTVLLILSCIGMSYFGKKSRFSNLYKDSITFFNRIQERQNLDIDALEAYKYQHSGRIHVVVIGESDCRDHWSLYGYHRSTTPNLEALFYSNNNFLYIPNAYSADKFTEYALAYALTEMHQYEGSKSFSQAYSIIDVLNKAGYNTYWISNQGRKNNFGSSFTSIGMKSKFRYFLDDKQFKFADDRPLDGNVRQKLKEIHFSHKVDSVVFIHLMGSHAPYAMRSERKFKKYQSDLSQNSVDQYDNSIVQLDSNLVEMFNLFGPKLESFVYFSDHGEHPGIGRDHFKPKMFRIPFFVYMKNKSDLLGFQTNINLNKPFNNEFIYDTLIGMYGISTPQYSEAFDYSSKNYKFDDGYNLLINSRKNTLYDIQQ